MSARAQFIEKFAASLNNDSFVKLTLSDPLPGNADEWRNLYARMVELKAGRHLQIVQHFAKRDVTQNLQPKDAPDAISKLLGTVFSRGYLFTNQGDWQWRGPDEGSIKAKRPTFTAQPALSHDRTKPKAITQAPWLTALGVTTPDGTARPGMADKLRQIERFTELLGHQIDASGLRAARRIVAADLGAGKGYLTFAVCDYLQKQGIDVSMTGVESRKDLVQTTNAVVAQCGIQGLNFIEGQIAAWSPEGPLDLLIALHACNTATDDALHLAIRSGTQLILTAPCCHQEIRPQITTPSVLAPALRHGILLEREAEIITDSIRALLLEIHGYAAQVFEFISPEHTGKNLMIAAHRLAQPRDPAPLRQQLDALLDFYGIRQQRLAQLLGEL